MHRAEILYDHLQNTISVKRTLKMHILKEHTTILNIECRKLNFGNCVGKYKLQVGARMHW